MATKQQQLTETFDVVCPKCKCDYLIPLVKLRFTRSFAGNRLAVEWPSRQRNNDSAVVACPSCSELIRIEEGGSVNLMGKKIKRRKA